MSIRAVNIVLGLWLFLSAFLWEHTQAQMTNTWVVGALCFALALSASRFPAARYFNTALSVWLFISTFALPTANTGTVWNNAIIAVAIFVVSLVESPVELGRRKPMQPA